MRLAWRAVIVILLLTTLMTVPGVRARVINWLQIGSIRIILPESTSATEQIATHAAEPPANSEKNVVSSTSITPSQTPLLFPPLSKLVGETTLEVAQDQLNFSIQIPAYPTDLGKPDHVFLQDLGGEAVLLVWMNPGDPNKIRLTLLQMGSGTFGEKYSLPVIEETSVNGQIAVWTEGSHYLQLGRNRFANIPLVVEGNVLIWAQDETTFRLETALPIDEAVRIAESIENFKPEEEIQTDIGSSLNESNSPDYVSLDNCPVTKPPDPPFTPPLPFQSESPYPGQTFWFGTAELWTLLPIDGKWEYNKEWGNGPFVQKIFWMNKDYNAREELTPKFLSLIHISEPTRPY